MSELLPCPFCGGEPDEYEGEYGNGVYCMQCGAMIGEPIHLGFNIAERVSYEQAIEAWNTRADDYRHAAEYWQRMYENTFAERTCQLIEDSGLLHCSECGGVAEERLWAYWHYCPNCGAHVTPKNSETTPKVVSE